MSIFGTSDYSSTTVTAMEGYTVNGGGLVALEESFDDMLSIMESVHGHDIAEIEMEKEVAALESQGAGATEIENVRESYSVVMEGAVKNVYDKIVNMLKKLWAKMKGYFANLVRFFDGLFKSGKEFAKKYENQLTSLDLSGYEYKMYDWDEARLTGTDVSEAHTKIESVIGEYASIGKPKESNKTMTDKKEEIQDAMRGKMLGTSSVDSSDYSEKLFAYFRKGATGPEDRDDVKVNVASLISILKADKQVVAIKKAQTAMDKAFSTVIKDTEKAKTAASKLEGGENSNKSDQVSFHSKKASLFRDGQTIANAFVAAWKDAVVSRNKEYKGALVSAFRYKADK